MEVQRKAVEIPDHIKAAAREEGEAYTPAQPIGNFAAIETKEVEVTCDKHGVSTSTVVMYGGEWTQETCKACREEAAQQRRREQAQEAADARKARTIELRKGISRIPDRFKNKRFDDFIPNGAEQESRLKTCKLYVEGFESVMEKGTSLIFCGNVGTGKTHLACAIGHELIDQGHKVRYTTVSAMIRQVRESWGKGSSENEAEALQKFIDHDLLLLDEVGVQTGSDNEKTIIFEIINARYERLKPTIVISNLAIEATKQGQVSLTDYIGERVIDRLSENGGRTLAFTWESQRGAKS